MKKSGILLGILLISSIVFFNSAYAATDIVYYDYTSIVTTGGEPFGIECNADDFVYMTTFQGGEGGLLKINKIDPNAATFISEADGSDWYSVESDSNGNLFINERDNGLVWKYVESTGNFSKFAVVEEIQSTPGAIVTYPTGFNNKPDTISIDLTSNGVGVDYNLNMNLGGHAGEVQYSNGFIWVSVNYSIDFPADVNTAGIDDVTFYGLARINPFTNNVQLIDLKATGATDIRGLVTDGNFIWITSQANDKVLKFDTTSETITENITLTNNSEPRGITTTTDYVFVALNKVIGGNSEVLRIAKSDLSQTVIDTGAINDNGGAFSVFSSGGTILWTDESGNTGSFLISGDSKTLTDTSSQTSSNHFGCEVNGEFWFAGKGSVKTGIVTIPSGISGSSSSNNSEQPKGNDNTFNSRPTMGKSHQTGDQLVDYGFFHNQDKYSITDNFYTPTEKIPIVTGEVNHFGLKTFVGDAQVMVGEISLVPQIGAFDRAEVRLESHFNFDKTLKVIKVIEKDHIIDRTVIKSYQFPVDCFEGSLKQDCVYVGWDNIVFLEKPVFDKVALNIINDNRQYQVTYLNDGFSFIGVDSYSPPVITNAVVENGKSIPLTRTDKKLDLWQSESGIIYKQNDFGTFLRQTPYAVIHSDDKPQNVMTRNHSDFDKLISYETARAVKIFDGSLIQAVLPEPFAYEFNDVNSRTQFLADNNMSWLRN